MVCERIFPLDKLCVMREAPNYKLEKVLCTVVLSLYQALLTLHLLLGYKNWKERSVIIWIYMHTSILWETVL